MHIISCSITGSINFDDISKPPFPFWEKADRSSAQNRPLSLAVRKHIGHHLVMGKGGYLYSRSESVMFGSKVDGKSRYAPCDRHSTGGLLPGPIIGGIPAQAEVIDSPTRNWLNIRSMVNDRPWKNIEQLPEFIELDRLAKMIRRTDFFGKTCDYCRMISFQSVCCLYYFRFQII